MLPTLLGQVERQKKHQYLYWELYERDTPNCAVRFGKWKGVVKDTRKGLKVELYDVKADQGEQKNLAAKHPDVVTKIQKIMNEAHVPNPYWDKGNQPLYDAAAACKATGVEPLPVKKRKKNNK